MSECRRPVSAEKSAALLRTSFSQGVSASTFNSLMVRYSRLDSCSGMPFIFEDKSTVRYPSIKACFKAALNMEKYLAAVLRESIPFLPPPSGAASRNSLKSSAILLSIWENTSLPLE
ncbi:hypothetical protein D3C86_1689160 [compost metagenome]